VNWVKTGLMEVELQLTGLTEAGYNHKPKKVSAP